MDPQDIDKRFTYHPPRSQEDVQAHGEIREAGRKLAVLIDEKITTDCREKSVSITKLEEAVMWANAALARHR